MSKKVAKVCYSLVPLQLPVRGLHMDRKLGKIEAPFNTVPEILSGEKNFEAVYFFKEWLTKTIRNNAASKRNILVW